MKIGFLFAGQGSQVVGMGKDIYDNYQIAKDIYSYLDSNIKDVSFNGPKELLDETMYAQPSILASSLAIAKILERNNIIPSFVCGLSLGEYSALAFSNVFNINVAIKLVTKRGEIMQNALPKNETGMVAVLGMDSNIILEEIKKVNGVCEIANYNCPGQIVISGEIKALDEAINLLTLKGARKCIKLNVSGAFHSSLLEGASLKLKEELDKYELGDKTYEIVYNTYGEPSNIDIKTILTNQIKSSVKFEQSIRYMLDNGVDTFIEIGPGNTLAGFVKKINKEVNVYSAFNMESLNKVIGELV